MKKIRPILLAMATFVWAIAARGEIQLWFSPTGPVGHSTPEHGFSRNDPHRFEWRWVKEAALHDRQPERSIVMNFLRGTHTNVYIGDVNDMSWNPKPTFTDEPGRWRITIRGLEPRAENTVLQFPTQFWSGANGFVSVIELVGDAQKKIDYARIVVEDLMLDGNWDQQKFSGPDFLGSYKVQPLRIFARTARIRNVIVHNYGAHNSVPQTTVNLAGCEIFPIAVTSADVGQEPEDGDPRPVVIEDCELDGLNSVYGGYCTAIAVSARVTREKTKPNYVSDVFSTDPNRRLFLVRRNQVRGYHPIAWGSSGGRSSESRGITFTGNVVVGGGLMMNTDTGVISYIDLTNNIGLGVGGLANHGWPNSDFKFGHHHYTITGNAIRFRGPWSFPIYQNYSYINGKPVTDDRGLVLGRMDTNPVAGVIFAGASSDTVFSGNLFTTESAEAFNRNVGPAARFQLLRKYEDQENVGESWPAFPRSASGNVTVRKNAISRVSQDFLDMEVLDEDRTFPVFTANSAVLHSQRRPALPSPTGSFQPFGTIERVSLITTFRPTEYRWLGSDSTMEKRTQRSITLSSDRITMGVMEVTLGMPSSNGHSVRVPVRAVMQPSAINKLQRTRPVVNRNIYIETFINGQNRGVQRSETGPDGLALFEMPSFNGNALWKFRAWVDAGLGSEGVFDPYQDAWATASWNQGNVVSLTTRPCVARVINGQHGRFVFHRSGSPEELARQLSVQVEMETSRPKAAFPGDYRMEAIGGTKWTPAEAGNRGTVLFSAGNPDATLDVAAAGNEGGDPKLVYLRIVSDSGTNYVTGTESDPNSPSGAYVLLLYK